MRSGSVAVALVVGSLIEFGAHQASAQFYLGAGGGANQFSDHHQNFGQFEPTTQTTFADGEKISMNTGASGTGSVGYSFGQWRVEVEGGYQRSTYNHFTRTLGFAVTPPLPPPTCTDVGGIITCTAPTTPTPTFASSTVATPISGTTRAYTGAVNVFYTVPTGIYVAPYVGLGVGGAREKSTALAASPGNADAVVLSAPFGNTHWANNFMFQSEVGVDIKVSNHFIFGPAFRYQQVVDDRAGWGNTNVYTVRLQARVVF